MKRAIILAGICCLAACSAGKSGKSSLPPVTMLSPDSANHQWARFSPDGSRLFWWEPAGQANQLWTADAKLGNPTKVPVTSFGLQPILWSPDGSQIAVPSSAAGLVQVAIIPAVGGPPRLLTTNAAIAEPAGWHRDGDRLTYLATAAGKGGGTFHSFVTSLSHGGASLLIPGETRPAIGLWSPDGSHIGYMVIDGSHTTIWVADSAGSNPRQLTTDGFESFSYSLSVWSPNSREIAYESRRTGTSDIWVVPIDGGAPRQLTRDIRNDTWPLWSPDGKWIAFLSDRGKQTDIWVVPAAGGQELRVTDDASAEELMQWLPGNKLAFLTGQGQSSVWAMSLADSAERRLTPDSLRVTPQNLSPDGKEEAVTIDRGGGVSDIALLPVAGGPMRTLVQGGNNSQVQWSPDGTRLAFTSDRGGTSDIWVVDAAGGEPRQLENWPGNERNPTWSGDGSAIYFQSDRDARLGDIWKVPAAGGEPVRVTKAGSLNSLMTHHGRPELVASIIGATGQFEVVQVKPDGAVVPVWQHGTSFPVDLSPSGDSLLIVQAGKGGSVQARIIPVSGRGDGQVILNPGEDLTWITDDWTWVAYRIPNGSTHNIGLLNRKDGTTRRLTTNSLDEGAAAVTPDGKTVVFQRSRAVRRIAIANLTKLLAGASKP
jgi:Tol biopolymer transport system component